MMRIVLFVALAFTSVFAFSDDFINEINSKQNLWKAGRNFPENITLSGIRHLLGARTVPQKVLETIPIKHHEVSADELPGIFDARTKWPSCKTIKQIADQSSCGSCWAVSVASAISDRICIHSNGKLQPEISANNIMACQRMLSQGCHGGIPYMAWLRWKSDGIVTGGAYGSNIGCQPYPFAPCEHYNSGSKPACPSETYPTPQCVQACDNSSLTYANELFYGGSTYQMNSNEEQIRAEIFKNGPVVAGFTVHTDFLQYKSGVYFHTSGPVAGLHDIRIIGWGEEKGTKYWLAANSWNEDWGDKGLFKVRRGNDECGIESEISAGLPK